MNYYMTVSDPVDGTRPRKRYSRAELARRLRIMAHRLDHEPQYELTKLTAEIDAAGGPHIETFEIIVDPTGTPFPTTSDLRRQTQHFSVGQMVFHQASQRTVRIIQEREQDRTGRCYLCQDSEGAMRNYYAYGLRPVDGTRPHPLTPSPDKDTDLGGGIL